MKHRKQQQKGRRTHRRTYSSVLLSKPRREPPKRSPISRVPFRLLEREGNKKQRTRYEENSGSELLNISLVAVCWLQQDGKSRLRSEIAHLSGTFCPALGSEDFVKKDELSLLLVALLKVKTRSVCYL
ncbi:hypothetical protein TNCT_77771 [Trichonephila clavata]|uniref:Uncharacterized protein n=1 Tax=Trichonephila clavata TaxID=2740835 RepID=A0A8X6L6I5_TRICU|nr:hypothetical protein TNCT_77771 [Trichonephila clavata]